MSLQKLDIFGVRNIERASIEPSPALNFIYGENGSGKSSLLEAIFILGRAASFRTNHIKHVINQHAKQLIVTGQALQKSGLYAHLGVQLDTKQCEIRINQQRNCKRTELVTSLPLQLFHPISYQLLDGSSSLRREFMDWGIFNHDERFLLLWRRFKKALTQRNALLKSRSTRDIDVWDAEVVEYAIPVADYRYEYIKLIQPIFLEICNIFLPNLDFKLRFFSGWDVSSSLLSILQESIERDSRYGFTHFGPHRSDFTVLLNNSPVKDFVSRGQLKLIVLSLKLAQIHLFQHKFSKIGCILIDDFTAELDKAHQCILVNYLSSMNIQVFLTTTDFSSVDNLLDLHDFKMFHMEQGHVSQIKVPRGT